MTDREKLIEMLGQCDGCNAEYCDQCEFGNDIDGCVLRQKEIIADTLLANGVTFATDTNVGGKWIPVTERLPKKQGFYLVAHQRSRCVAERFYYQDCPDLFVKTTGDPVTHWMPLPEPPEEE